MVLSLIVFPFFILFISRHVFQSPFGHLRFCVRLFENGVIVLQEAPDIFNLPFCKKRCIVGMAVHATVGFPLGPVGQLFFKRTDIVFNSVGLRPGRRVKKGALSAWQSMQPSGFPLAP